MKTRKSGNLFSQIIFEYLSRLILLFFDNYEFCLVNECVRKKNIDLVNNWDGYYENNN